MEMAEPTPKSMSRAKEWTDMVEEAYRFQCAGYRDELEYKFIQKTDHVSPNALSSLGENALPQNSG